MNVSPSDEPHPAFPDRMFAFGEEPLGIRVTAYHKPSCISKILNALDEEEVRFIQQSPFGKLIEIAEKPSFSGRFGRYLFSRQLKTRKRNEVWFIFAGKPIRFSIKEFALVTGLNCRNYPPHSKKRSMKLMSEKPYWGDLFGNMTEVPVSYVVTLLKKKTVTDSSTRIKFALLALVSAVILPTSHTPRILQVHAEKIRDVDQFMSYPWGRAAFDMLMSSIKERNEVSLSQNTIAFKGFVMAVQLVLIEAVPSLLCDVRDGGSSDSEEESAEGEEVVGDDGEGKKSINTGHVRDIDTACKVHVNSIISNGVVLENIDSTVDVDEEDMPVDNLVKAVEEGFPFSNSHFKGGSSTADVNRMREEAKNENLNRKTGKVKPKHTVTDGINAEHVAAIVEKSVCAQVTKIGVDVKDLALSICNSQNMFQKNILSILSNFQRELAKSINSTCNRPHALQHAATQTSNTVSGSIPEGDTISLDAADIIQNAMCFANKESTVDPKATPEDLVLGREDQGIAKTRHAEGADVVAEVTGAEESQIIRDVGMETRIDEGPTSVGQPPAPSNDNSEKVDTGLSFPDPSFSIGLTQLDKPDPIPSEDDDTTHELDDEAPVVNRKSKRARVVPRNLVGDYQCDKRLATRAWEAYINAICSTPSADYSDKFAMLLEKIDSSFVMDFGSLTLASIEMSAMVERSSHLAPKILDVLIHHTRSVFLSKSEHLQLKHSVFLDTKFVTLMAKSFTKFSKASKKETVRFPPALIALLACDCEIAEATRFYFPFNFDKQHWVGVCVDFNTSQVVVLDCNTAIKTDASIAKDMRPVSQMFPYILKQAGKQLSAKELKALAIDRPRVVPQNSSLFDSGITSTLLIQAHAVGGVDVCKCITPDVVSLEVQRIAVTMYEENVGVL